MSPCDHVPFRYEEGDGGVIYGKRERGRIAETSKRRRCTMREYWKEELKVQSRDER